MSKRNAWEKMPKYEIIPDLKDEENLSETAYILGKKPPLPVVA